MDRGIWEGLLTEQVRESGRALFGVACRIVRDPQAAEDACQTAFAKAWELGGSGLNSPRDISRWLHQVVINESLVLLRRRKVEANHRDRVAASRTQGERTDGLAQLEIRESVIAALSQIDEPARTVVVMRVMQGRSGNEVALLMGVSAAEVSRRLREGMEKLRGVL